MLKIIKSWKKNKKIKEKLMKNLIEQGFTKKEAKNIILRLEMMEELENARADN